MPGRRPKPTKLKLLDGNPGKKPIPRGEPEPDTSMPQPPAYLDDVALAEWHSLAPELHRIGVLTIVDRTALAAYCESFSQFVRASETLRAEGDVTIGAHGGQVAHPCVAIANQAKSMMHKYLIEFGLTPASRAKLAKGEPKVDDPLEVFNQRKARR